jgi:hypothetical protein
MTKFFFAIGMTALMFCTACNEKDNNTTTTETTKTDADKKADDIDAAKVPDAVKTAFAAKYAAATDVKWETATEDGKSTYKVKWKEGDVKKKAEFGADGSFIKEDKD